MAFPTAEQISRARMTHAESKSTETSAMNGDEEVTMQGADDKEKFTPNILHHADEIAGTDRSRDYGHPLPNHQRIADMWSVQAESVLKPGVKFTPELVALMMIGLKLARLVNSPDHYDSMLDVCGYAKCWDMIREAQAGK
jgi:hypothetical protein